MDDYDYIKISSLKFKGEKRKKKSKHSSLSKKSSRDGDISNQPSSSKKDERREDADDHGGWWKVDKYDQIKDDIAIEFIPGCYAKALSNGNIVLGNPHPPGEGPDEEEIFTVVAASTNQIALKSGFGRYLSIDSRKRLVGLSEAIGESENFLPVFEDGKCALCAYNDCFLAPNEEDDTQPIVAKSEKVGSYEVLNIRINNDPIMFSLQKEKDSSAEIIGKLYETELNYLKKYQSHGERNFSIKDDKKHLKKARVEGQLHEALLDKREKIKSDKYCK